MRRIGHIVEHAPNNLGQLLHGNRQARRGEYYNNEDNARAYPTDTGGPQAEGAGVLWPEQQPADPAWESWQPGITPGDGWPDAAVAGAYPGFQADDVSSDDTSSMTSSDSGREEIDMSDLRDLNDRDAAEQVFWQYRHHRRKWRRFTGKPVRRFRRSVRRFTKRRYPNRFHRGSRFGGRG